MPTGGNLGPGSEFQGSWESILAIFVVAFTSALANTAGVGGGAVFVPVFNVLVGFPLKASTAISQTIIALGKTLTSR